MWTRILGILLIIAGIIGGPIPVVPGTLIVVLGILTFFAGREGKLRRFIPQRIPVLAARIYNRVVAPVLQPLHDSMVEAIAAKAPGRILDVGAGTGALAVGIARRLPGARVAGVDFSPAMANIASRAGAGIANLVFAVMDGKQMACVDDEFDLIVSTSSLHHWRQPVRVFNEIYRCLKPGGEAWIVEGYSNVDRAAIERALRPKGWGWIHYRIVMYSLKIHGFNQEEYDTTVKDAIAQSHFREGAFSRSDIMMHITLRKPATAVGTV